jgi:formate-dependent nitrite reductase cytochrome c552 subunit
MLHGCQDCGYRRHAAALQFDHRPDEVKVGNISDWSGDIESMIAEMDKCDVVCANCHAIRTELRRSQPAIISARPYHNFLPYKR